MDIVADEMIERTAYGTLAFLALEKRILSFGLGVPTVLQQMIEGPTLSTGLLEPPDPLLVFSVTGTSGVMTR